MPKIDGERLLNDLKRLAEFGRYKSGVDRPTYSDVDIASRQWLADKYAAAGLSPVIDGIGNVFGRAEGVTRRLLVGSHSETQPRGGWLDGALGVVYGLELARAFAADPELKGLGIETVAWADEEGHYGNMLGSRSFTGRLSEVEIDGYANRAGEKLRDALTRAGYAGRPRIAVDPARYLGYLEAHIEQGNTLELHRPADRHRRGHRRHLELVGHLYRPAEPCRHDADGPPQGCRRRDGAAGDANP